MKNKICLFILLTTTQILLFGQSDIFPKYATPSFLDAGIGVSKVRNGYLLYSDFSGVTYTNFDKKLYYSPLWSVRGKISDGPFKYRFFFNFIADRRDNIVHDTSAYTLITSFNQRGLYPRIGFERQLWSKWVELRIGTDFMYIYELFDTKTFAQGMVIPNLPLEMDVLTENTTNAWGVSPFLNIGFTIKKRFFISAEGGFYLAYGTTGTYYNSHSVNLHTNHSLDISEYGKPKNYYKFDNNTFFQFSIDYRFLKKDKK